MRPMCCYNSNNSKCENEKEYEKEYVRIRPYHPVNSPLYLFDIMMFGVGKEKVADGRSSGSSLAYYHHSYL